MTYPTIALHPSLIHLPFYLFIHSAKLPTACWGAGLGGEFCGQGGVSVQGRPGVPAPNEQPPNKGPTWEGGVGEDGMGADMDTCPPPPLPHTRAPWAKQLTHTKPPASLLPPDPPAHSLGLLAGQTVGKFPHRPPWPSASQCSQAAPSHLTSAERSVSSGGLGSEGWGDVPSAGNSGT